MRAAEVLLLDFDNAVLNTRRTIERVPEGKDEWRPHPRSMPLGKLAMHCATLTLFGFYIMEDEAMDIASSTRTQAPLVFTTRDACLASLHESSTKCRASIEAASDAHLAARWRFSFGEHLISEDSRAQAFRQMCFNHLVHHTAQLGVYLRLNDVPVPALYGPSADEQWSPGA